MDPRSQDLTEGPLVDTQLSKTISALVDGRFEAETAFLAALVRQPSDNPPGDCDPHAAITAELLEKLGFEVERHLVPPALVAENGMKSATNLIVRLAFGSGFLSARCQRSFGADIHADRSGRRRDNHRLTRLRPTDAQ